MPISFRAFEKLISLLRNDEIVSYVYLSCVFKKIPEINYRSRCKYAHLFTRSVILGKSRRLYSPIVRKAARAFRVPVVIFATLLPGEFKEPEGKETRYLREEEKEDSSSCDTARCPVYGGAFLHFSVAAP